MPEFKRVLWKKCIIKDILSVSKSLFFHIAIFSLLQEDTALVVLLMCALQCHQQTFRFGILAFSFSKKKGPQAMDFKFLNKLAEGVYCVWSSIKLEFISITKIRVLFRVENNDTKLLYNVIALSIIIDGQFLCFL